MRITFTPSDGTANVPVDVYRVWIGMQGWAGYATHAGAMAEAVRVSVLLNLGIVDETPFSG
jgi:hypothetical protein